MNVDQQLQQIISRVVSEYHNNGQVAAPVTFEPQNLVTKAKQSHKKLVQLSLTQREEVVCAIRSRMAEVAPDLLREAIAQTKMGCIQDKLVSLGLILKSTPGLEDLAATVNTGDHGLTLNEYSAYGVIASIVPLNNTIETIICNVIGMVAAGNAAVFAVPKQVYDICQKLINELNLAINKAGGPEQLIGVLTCDKAQELVLLSDVDMVVITATDLTGLNFPINKKVIYTGVSHVPVIVDETADIKQAARDIVAGASFDCGLSFVSEKALVVVDSVADFLIHHLTALGAYIIRSDELQRLEKLLINEQGEVLFCGRSARDILALLGVCDQENTKLVLFEVDDIRNKLVQSNLMLPVLPIIRAKDVCEAVATAKKIEGGRRHTAVMYSKHIDHLTLCARELQVILFIKNAPSYAGLGLRGEGYTSFTISSLTGEGLVGARHFSRARRCVLSEGFLIK